MWSIFRVQFSKSQMQLNLHNCIYLAPITLTVDRLILTSVTLTASRNFHFGLDVANSAYTLKVKHSCSKTLLTFVSLTTVLNLSFWQLFWNLTVLFWHMSLWQLLTTVILRVAILASVTLTPVSLTATWKLRFVKTCTLKVKHSCGNRDTIKALLTAFLTSVTLTTVILTVAT